MIFRKNTLIMFGHVKAQASRVFFCFVGIPDVLWPQLAPTAKLENILHLSQLLNDGFFILRSRYCRYVKVSFSCNALR